MRLSPICGKRLCALRLAPSNSDLVPHSIFKYGSSGVIPPYLPDFRSLESNCFANPIPPNGMVLKLRFLDVNLYLSAPQLRRKSAAQKSQTGRVFIVRPIFRDIFVQISMKRRIVAIYGYFFEKVTTMLPSSGELRGNPSSEANSK